MTQKSLDTKEKLAWLRLIRTDNIGPITFYRLLERFGSKAATVEGSNNIVGIQDKAVDALLDRVVSAQTRPQLVAAVKALDRVLRHGHYAVPHWYGSVHRVAWRAGRFEQPAVTPRYYQPETWSQSTWWASPANLRGEP